MAHYDDSQVANRLNESARWLFRKLMEAEAIKLEAAARKLAKGE
jgi:hypothetical protein